MKRLLACLALVLVCAWAYAPVVDNGFVNYDDNKYLTENPVVQRGLSAEGLRWAFDNRQTANFHPLTWLSHMLDVELFGLEPGPHHLMSVGLHALAACALFLAFMALGIAYVPALLVALLFVVHPLRVESVAWAAERKDVLSGLFFALTLLAWAGHVRNGNRWLYSVAAVCLLLGLTAKAMLVTLPLVLLLLDVWPLRRLGEVGWRRLLVEKTPLFALVLVFVWMTLRTQSAAGAVRSADLLSFGARLANACSTTWVYVLKTLEPSNLAVFYPHPALVDPDAAVWNAASLGGLAALLAMTALAFWARRRLPELLVGWLWFLVMLTPVVGLVQVGGQAWADRYAYLPTVGLYLGLVATLAAILRPQATATRAAALLGVVLIAFLGTRTRAQVEVWRDSETLFRHALSVTEHNAVAHFSLGATLLKDGRLGDARMQLEEAIAIDPDYANAHYNLGVVLQALGDPQRAVVHFRRTLELSPEHVDAHVNLGLSMGLSGAYEASLEHFERAVSLAPEDPRVHTSLGIVARRAGDRDLALQAFGEALRRAPRSTAAHYQMGRLHEELGEPAIALRHYEAVLAGEPGHLDAGRRFAWLAATTPSTDAERHNAVVLARRAVEVTHGRDAVALDVLAAALAAKGEHAAAVDAQLRAIALEAVDGVDRHSRLDRFRSGRSLAPTDGERNTGQ